MKQVPIKLGPLALLLAVISICLTTLSILTFTTASADMRLAEKYAETVTTRYELEMQGQKLRQEAAHAGAPAGEPDEDGIFWSSYEKDGARLRVGMTADGEIVSWRHEKDWKEDTDIGNLWAGF